MPLAKDPSRRELLASGLVLTGGMLITARGYAQKKEHEEEEKVSPVEDLMREHGLLDRILLIYEDGMVRLQNQHNLDLHVIHEAATIVKAFVEDYHEKLEEDYVFPRFEKAGQHTDLVATLRDQHKAGREVTSRILSLTQGAPPKSEKDRHLIADTLEQFVHMYRPHSAREETVLFPDFRALVGDKEYANLGEVFEDKETKSFGSNGFRKMVARVADLEKTLGIDNLSSYTPS